MKDFATRLIAGSAFVIASAALAAALVNPAPLQGRQGPSGPPGAQGTQGQQGPAGTPAPVLGYQCQMLFPLNGGTETTFYWPCTNKGG
jgi:hypothetical protein